MTADPEALQVPLDGSIAMRLRPSELEAVADGLGEFETSVAPEVRTLADALRRIPSLDRAPTWELAVRRYGRRKPLDQAAGEIGMDLVHAQELLEALAEALAAIPQPESRLDR